MFREEEKTVFLVFSDFAIDHGSSQSLEWREAFSSWVFHIKGQWSLKPVDVLVL